ncbi:MAG: hypothetical protein GWP66_09335 [Gammaproteobacteria bacterium]|jgi:hypothetical protein|nr:hypothetical protein [Gammaproteobacteria bacterium]
MLVLRTAIFTGNGMQNVISNRLATTVKTVFVTAMLSLASTAAAAVMPVQGQGIVERPIGGGGFYGQPSVVSEGFFEAHPGRDGQLWILDRQTGRVRSCAPPDAADQPPRCSPWSQ